MHIHYLQHVPFEGPGSTRDWFIRNGHTISITPLFDPNFRLPDMGDIDGLVIMGGPMGAYDDDAHPWLTKEKEFIKDCIREKKKILGICLGAQLTAVCLGGAVGPAPQKEIGWFPIFPTTECKAADPVIDRLLNSGPVVFHWHGDQFSIPPGATGLAVSSANTNQAYRYSDHIIGLQFHLECTPANIDAMLDHGSDELQPRGQSAPFIQSAGDIRNGIGHCATMNPLMDDILEHLFSNPDNL